MVGKATSVSVITVVLLGGLAGLFVFEPDPVSAFATHDPILIVGNENFNSSNGVVGGNGTEADPYIIEGWEINTTSAIPIEIRNTTAYFVIQNVSLYSQSTTGILLQNCTNGTITDLKASYLYLRIRLSHSDNNRFIDNNITKAWVELYLSYSSNNTIKNNIFSNNSFDIQLEYSHNNSITANKIRPSTYGILLMYSENNNVSDNEILGWVDVGTGVYLSFSPNNVVSNNNISKVRDGIVLRESNNITITDNLIEDNNMHGIDIEYNCDDISLYRNNIFRSFYGIVIVYSARIQIYNNNISFCYESGLKLYDSFDIEIEDNTIMSDSYYGLDLIRVINSTIKDNRIFQNDKGIILSSASHISIENNEIKYNTYGIRLINSINNYVLNNKIKFNSGHGIALGSDSDDNHFEGNRIEKNEIGLDMQYCSSINITSNDFVANDYGIRASSIKESNFYNNQFLFNKYEAMNIQVFSNNNRIISNYCRSDVFGFIFTASSNNDILGNTIDSYYMGIQLWSCENNVLRNNTLIDDGISIVGEYIHYWSTNDIDTTNTVNDKPIYYWVDKNSGQVPGNAGQIFLVNCTDVTVSGLTIKNTYNAISLAFSESNKIIDNVCENNINGIYLLRSENNKIEGNSFSENLDDGIILDQSNGNTIYDNECSENIDQGISTYYSHKNIVENNTISKNDIGVELYLSNTNILRNNSCTDNFDMGIRVYFSKTNEISRNQINNNNNTGIWSYYGEYNSIMHNEVSSGNSYGIISTGGGHNDIINNTIESNSLCGIYLDQTSFNQIDDNYIAYNVNGIKLEHAEYNQIYHNSFWNNINQTQISGEEDNQWNLAYPYGGNYWGDYTGNDYYQGPYRNIQGWDGIGDDPYDMAGGNSDQYPLMKPWGGLPTAPRELVLTPGCGFIQLNWLYPADSGSFPIMNFTIYKGEAIDNLTLYMSVGIANEYNDTDVENGKLYYYQLQAGQQVGDSPRTPIMEAMPGFTPSAPQDLVATESNDYIALLWEEPEFDGCMPITHYLVYKGFASGSLQEIAKVTNTEFFIDENVTEGIFYYYQVSAVNAIGEGTRSGEASYIIAALPLAPLNVTAVSGDRYVRLTWEPPLSDGGMPIDSYYVYRNNTDGSYEAFIKVDEDVFTFIDTEVDNGIKYGYKVRAKNKIGKGPLSPVAYATPEKPPLTTNVAPRAQISAYNTTGPPPLNVTFEGSGIDKDGTIKSYIWDFDDGNRSYEKNPTHTFLNYGMYYVRLTVIDDEGASGQAMITIVVTSDELPPDGKEEEKEDSKEVSSAWFYAPVAGIVICIMILILLLFMWLKVKEEKPEIVERKRIVREPIAYRRLKRLRSVEEEEFYDQELEE